MRLQITTKQPDWQHTDVWNGEESLHLNQLTQLIVKIGPQISTQVKFVYEQFEDISGWK